MRCYMAVPSPAGAGSSSVCQGLRGCGAVNPDPSGLPLGQEQPGGCPGDGKMLMQVADLSWALCV